MGSFGFGLDIGVHNLKFSDMVDPISNPKPFKIFGPYLWSPTLVWESTA